MQLKIGVLAVQGLEASVLSIEGVLYLAALGRGSRNCLDSNFETSMLYLAIAMIAARYEISTI
jgi:hypothetical protein